MSENTYNYHIGALQTLFDIIATNKNVWKSIERKEENKKKHKLLSKKKISNILEVFNDDRIEKSGYLLPKIQERYSRNPDSVKTDIKKFLLKQELSQISRVKKISI